MPSNESLFNLPDLEQTIHRFPTQVSPDTPLREVICCMIPPHLNLQELCQSSPDLDGDLAQNLRKHREAICQDKLNRNTIFELSNEAVRTSDPLLNESYAVVAEFGEALGILTERDLVKAIASGHSVHSEIKIAELMTPFPTTLNLKDAGTIFTPLLLFRQYKISHLPILDQQGKLLGIVTPGSILQALPLTNLFKLSTVEEVTNPKLLYASCAQSVEAIAQRMTAAQTHYMVLTADGSSTPVGIITESKIILAWALGMDLSQTPASWIMRQLGYPLKPEHSLLFAYHQMQSDRRSTLLVGDPQAEPARAFLGSVTPTELLRALEPLHIYRRLKRTQQSVCHLQAEKAELLRQRNTELEFQVQQRTAQLQALLQAVEQEARQAALLNKIVQAMRGTLDLDAILQTTVNQLHEVLNISRCLIFRPDAEQHLAVHYVSEATVGAERLIGVRCDFYRHYYPHLSQGKALRIPCIDGTYPPEIQQAAETCQIRAILIVPLMYQDAYIGGISLHECEQEREWTDDEERLLQAIADHCAIAIHQAELYQQVQTQLQERRKVEAALRTSEELFRQLAENIPQIFFVRNVKPDQLLYVSPAFEQIWGYRRDILHDNPNAFVDTVHPEDRDRLISALQTLDSHQVYNQEYRIIRPDGEIRWVADRAFPLTNEQGEVYRITGLVEDITERKKNEIVLREQKQFLQTVLDANPNFIFVKDHDGKYILANQACAEACGTTVAEMLGKTHQEFNLNPQETEQYIRDDQDVFETLKPKFIPEEPLTTASGELRWLQTVKVPLRSPDGEGYQVLGVATDITERKRAEEALQKSHRLIRLITDNLPALIGLVDHQERYRFVNLQYEEYFGLSASQIIGKSVQEVIGDENYQKSKKEIQNVLSGQTVTQEKTLYSKAGQKHSLLAKMVPQFDEDGTVQGYFILSQDITERKQAEEALRESEERFRLMADQAPVFIWVTEKDGCCSFVNKTCLEFTGIHLEDYLGNGWTKLIHPEDAKSCVETISNAEQKLQSFQIEYRIKRASGEYVWILDRGVPRFTPSGQFIGYIGTAIDISQRKNVEFSLKASQEMLRLVMDNIPQFIFWKDKNSVYLGCNQNFAKAAGLNRPEHIIGKTDYDLPWNQEESDGYRAYDQRIMTANQPNYRIVETQKQADGQQRWVETNKIPLHDSLGNVIGILGTYEDITERKRLEEEKRKTQVILEGIFNNTYQLTALLNLEGVFLKINQATLDFVGVKETDFLGKFLWEMPCWETAQAVQVCLKEAIARAASGQFVRYEIEAFNADRTRATLDFSLKPLLNEQGQVIKLIAEGRDISPRKQAEENLQKLNEALETKVQERTQILRKTVEKLALEVSLRQKAEATLQENQQQLQAILDNSPTVIYLYDQENRYLMVNSQFESLFNLTREQIIGKGINDLWPPIIAEQFAANNCYVRETGTPLKTEEIVPHEDGLHTYISIKFPLRNATGEIYAVCGISTDITDRKRSEEALQESQQQLQDILDHSPAMIYLRDLEGRYMFINRTYATLFDLNQAEIVGQRVDAVFSPDVAEVLDIHNQEIIRQNRPLEFEEMIPIQNQPHTYISVKFPLKDRQGQLYAICGICTDITPRKRAEEALQESEAKFQKMAANVPGMIYQYVLHPDGSDAFPYISASSRQLWEVDPEEVYQDAHIFHRLIHPDDLPSILTSTQASAATLEPWQWEGRIITPSGQLKWIQGVSRPEKQDNGDIVWDGLIIDISDRKAAEEALRNSELRLGLALDAAQMGTWDWNIQTHQVIWSEKTESIFGFAPGTFPGTQDAFMGCIHPEERDIVGTTIQHALAAKSPHNCESRIIQPDGTIRWIACIGNIICDEAGNANRVTGVVMDITERKQAEERLREKQRRLQQALQAAKMGTWDWETETNRILWSEQTESMFGFAPGAFPGTMEAYQSSIHPDDRDLLLQKLTQTFQVGMPYVVEHRIIWPDGSIHWVVGMGDVTYSSDNMMIGMSGVVMDITERKQAEEILRRQLAAVEAASDGIAILNHQGEYVYLNEAYVEIFGYDRASDLIGKTWHELYYVDEAERMEREVFSTLQYQEKWQGEAVAKRRDGITFAQEVSFTAIVDDGFICVCRDITERKQTEEILRLRDRAIAGSRNGIIIVDARLPDQPVIYVNPAFERMTGYAASEVLGFNCRFLQGHETTQEGLDELRQAIRQGYDCTVVIRNYRKDGSLFWNELTISPIQDEAGILTHFIGIQTDITERKAAEAEIKASLKEKEVLLQEIHHRVKNNLQVISSLLKLQSGYIEDNKTLNLFMESYNRVKSMALIHEQLYQSKDLGKIDAIGYIRELTDNLLRSYQISSKAINLRLEIDDFALDIDTAIPCGLIINELVTNSLKYGFVDRNQGEIKIDFLRQTPDHFCLKVRDNGVGLAPDFNIENIESLGLQLVYNLTEQLDGKIEIEWGAGTGFVITFRNRK